MTSFSRSNGAGKGGWGASPGVLRLGRIGLVGLTTLFLPALAMAAPLGPAIEQPDRNTIIFQLDEAAPQASRNDTPMNQQVLAARIRGHIDASRASGSPRPLGLAQGLMAQVPEAQWTPHLYLLRATVLQRLHRFDEARDDLQRVIAAEPGNRQAWLTRFTIAMVQGDMDAAGEACLRFGELEPGLWADSCAHDIASYGDDPEGAFESLQLQIAQASNASPAALDWALVTLADMATRLGKTSAGRYWALGLKQDPDDLYRRVRYADWLLARDQPKEALKLTAGYEAMDTLAVLRAVALTRLQHPARDELVADLDARFAEARWRGEFLHQWEYARYLLDVKEEPVAALDVALANWKTQRAWPDRQLLIRAARAANDQKTLETLEKLDAGRAAAIDREVLGSTPLLHVAR